MAACVLAAAAVLMLSTVQSLTQDGPDAAALVGALSDYATECRDGGRPLAPVVTLQMLVRSGHLQPSEAMKWDGVHIGFFNDADETRPQRVLVQAVMPDGSGLAVLSDGSVQQLTRARLRTLHGEDGPASALANPGPAPASQNGAVGSGG